VFDVLFGDGAEGFIAHQTAGEGHEAIVQVVVIENLFGLGVGVGGTYPVSPSDVTVVEERFVPGEQDAFLGYAGLDEILVGIIILVQGVKPQHSQDFAEFSEVHIHHERHFRRWELQMGDEDVVPSWIEGDAILIVNSGVEIFWFTVDENQIDLGMRNAEVFSDVFHGRKKSP